MTVVLDAPRWASLNLVSRSAMVRSKVAAAVVPSAACVTR